MYRVLVFSFALLAVTPDVSAQQRLTPELLWKLQRVSDPQVSPSGRYLTYSVRTYDLATDQGRSRVWLLDLATARTRPLTTAGASSWGARWRRDGKRIAFLSTRDGAPQAYVLSLDGGDPERLTDVEGGVANLAWSPDGTHISFTARVKLDPSVHDLHPDLPKATGKIYDSLMIRHWNRWRDGTYSHLFVQEARPGAGPRDLMAGERFDTPLPPFGGGEQIAWSPDGREICYTAKKVAGSAWAASTDSDLYVVRLGDGSVRNLTEGMPGYDQDPVYSPDGRWIAFRSMARAGFESDRSRVMLYDREKGVISELTPGFDASAQDLAWAPDSKSLYFDADTRGTTQVYRVFLAGGAPRPVSEGRWQFRGPVPSPDGRHVFCLRQRTERPYEIVRLETDGKSEGSPLTDHNGALFAGLELPRVEARTFRATDGKPIHAWVIYPPDFDPHKKWPMLLYCQGGPQSQVGQWFSYRWNFHLMAARGYVVLAPNRRGLPGFGQEWNDAISRDWGGQAMRDLLSATDAMFEEPWVDREHTAAVGASFGGYTVYWLMGHDRKDRFCAMVAHCGVFNLEAMYLSTEELFFPDWDLGGPYWSSPEVWRDYERFSPHRFVGEWDTPLLVIHGEKDFRVPVAQGIQAFTAAQIRKIPSRFLYFPDEGHWVLKPQNGVLWHRVFFDWLDRWCKPAAKPAPERSAAPAAAGKDGGRRYLLERVDDTAIVQLYADGFEKLSLRDKLLCYWLSRAAIAGRDIFLDQKFAYSLPIRDLLEELYVHRRALAPKAAAEIERYTKLFWVHNGIHNAVTARKEILRLDFEEFDAACRAAVADGARISETVPRDVLYTVMTDPARFAMCTNKSPGPGKDPLLESCNNLYVDVSLADLQGFVERYPLNSRLVKLPGGRLVEQVYRAGDGGEIPPGLYAREILAVIRCLEEAGRYAPPATAKCLDLLVRYYRTGDPQDWRAYNIAWVQDTGSVVDQINGFVEVYLDARGQKGAWEAVVSFLNPARTEAMRPFLEQIQWFEDHMPWDDEFKKENVKGIAFRAISVITETGDSGPVTPIGINLPNEADIRQQFGSKSVNLANVVEAYERSRGASSAEEFAWSEAEVERARKWGALSDDVHTNLHEVVGHASGKVREDVGNPADRLGPYYSTIEEGRADLVALYWIGHPRLRELGVIPGPEAALARYEAYARNALVQLRRVPRGGKIEEDHMRNRQMIVHWLIANTDAVAVEKRDGKTYYRVTDAEKFRRGCGKLLAEVMRIKATGDFEAAKDLVERYGTHVDPELHEEVLERIAALNLPSVTGFVQPELRLVRDAQGRVVDVEVWYPLDLADQMLRWSGRRP